jgi:hypothetical protein
MIHQIWSIRNSTLIHNQIKLKLAVEGESARNTALNPDENLIVLKELKFTIILIALAKVRL